MPNIESYKRREISLILLNILVLAALFIVHIVFLFEIGKPSKYLLVTLVVRFVLLIVELVWIQKLDPRANPRRLRLHSRLSIWINIVFAFIASIFGGTPDSHYSVLMIIPIIQAAFHFNLAKTLGIVSVAIVLTFAEVWIYFWRKPPVDYGEFFEAATVTLIFFVVGFVVRLLAGNLGDEEIKLQASLDELREMQNRLVAEEKMAAVGQLASAIAHEIRNPVAMIASSLEMAARQPENSPLRTEMFEIAAEESKRLEVLTDDFLKFARTKEPELVERSVDETLDYVAALVRTRLAEQGVEVEVAGDAGLVCRFDDGQIRQALLNLVVNAVESAGERGVVALGAENAAEGIVWFVENDGPSIGENLVPRIFEPFFTGKPKGTGLGLAIVRKIARAHGGEARLARNENGLVRFEILIPKG
ncbi:MAG: HAMP domain-containing histidine kinase [Acidobacteria bacterium]|nr:HAMP domain-containing histidine kinase [Acidobacteriota bacterium]